MASSGGGGGGAPASTAVAAALTAAVALAAAASAAAVAYKAWDQWLANSRQRRAVELYQRGAKREKNSQSSRLQDDLILGTGRSIADEMAACYRAIAKARTTVHGVRVNPNIHPIHLLILPIGRGAVYFGSARFTPSHPFYARARELAGAVARLLDTPAWSGGGKGMMGAVTEGAHGAGYPVGAIRLQREASDAPGQQPKGENPMHAASITCLFMASRKIGLTEAGMRLNVADRTAFIFLPGGIGTLDELAEILVLKQLNKLGTNFPVPMIFVNYDGFYDGLISFLGNCVKNGSLSQTELEEFVVCGDNDSVLKNLNEFYQSAVSDVVVGDRTM
eukprot:jgi/Chlat1/7073/Chrsp57S06773